MAFQDNVRYGVFLLPDARTSAAVTTITGCLRAQFGTASAGRFPPHITLAGSLPLAVDESELVGAVQEVAKRHNPIPVINAGPKILWDSVLAFDVHQNGEGLPNLPLIDLAADVTDVVRPLLRPANQFAADIHPRGDWHGHLSLASHELVGQPELRDEIAQFVQQLGAPYPAGFSASRLAVFRLHHSDWTGNWWTDFWWEYVGSLALSTT